MSSPIIKARHNDQPHPDFGGWENFLLTCELRDEHDGVKYYGLTNCNYILFPTGDLLQNYGFNGKSVMSDVRDRGWQTVLAEIKADRDKIDDLLGRPRET